MSDRIYGYKVDPKERTRASQRLSHPCYSIEKTEEQIRTQVRAQGAFYPKNFDHARPSFNKEVTEHFFNESQSLYLCKTRHGEKALPRKKDLTQKQKKNPEFATIGHKKQWQEFVADKADPQEYSAHVGDTDYTVSAYSKADVQRLYNDLTNLQLESNKYNSSKAYTYPNHYPLQPTYKKRPK